MREMKQSVLFQYMPEGKVPESGTDRGTALSFGDTEAEFQAAVRGWAITDHSTLGRIAVTGKDRIDLLHRLSTNSLAGLSEGRVVSTVFVNDKGRTIDRVIVAAREHSLVLITSAGAEPFLSHWIEKYTITEDITFEMITDDTVMVSLLGSEVISKFTAAHGIRLDAGTCTTIRAEGGEFFVIGRVENETPVAHIITGSAGAARLAEEMTSIPGARWIGSGAYQAFRIFSGIPGRPGELNDTFNPLECGLRDSISFTKGCYIGQEVIARLDTYGKVRRRLTGIRTAERVGHSLPVPLLKDGAEAGMLTSMTESPIAGHYMGLAVLRNDMGSSGDTLDTDAGGVRVHVVITSFPHQQPG
jgi:tRNA-modifying protein YgfZ